MQTIFLSTRKCFTELIIHNSMLIWRLPWFTVQTPTKYWNLVRLPFAIRLGKWCAHECSRNQKNKNWKSYGQCVNEIIDLPITYWLMASKGTNWTTYFKIDFDEFFIGFDFILCGFVYDSSLICIHSKDLISTISNLSK